MDDIKKTQSKHNKLPERFLKHGGPGRPKGSKNKFTKIKEELASLFEEEDLKDKLRTLANGNKRDLVTLLDRIITILPKEPLVDQSTHIANIKYEWSDETDKDSVQSSRVSEGDTQE